MVSLLISEYLINACNLAVKIGVRVPAVEDPKTDCASGYCCWLSGGCQGLWVGATEDRGGRDHGQRGVAPRRPARAERYRRRRGGAEEGGWMEGAHAEAGVRAGRGAVTSSCSRSWARFLSPLPSQSRDLRGELGCCRRRPGLRVETAGLSSSRGGLLGRSAFLCGFYETYSHR
jgi:hypothetical protein